MLLIRWKILTAEDAASKITVRKFYDDISFQIIRNVIITLYILLQPISDYMFIDSHITESQLIGEYGLWSLGFFIII